MRIGHSFLRQLRPIRSPLAKIKKMKPSKSKEQIKKESSITA
jgi:hypothetical protein